MTLREKVARAIWKARRPPYPFEAVSGDELIDLMTEADAALAVVREALREPTHEMLEAGHGELPCTPGGVTLQCAGHVWLAQLAASPLAEGNGDA